MRLFFSIRFAGETAQRLAELSRRLGEGRPAPPENFHLTLAFLGETDPQRLPALRRVLDGLEPVPMDLVFDRLGSFCQRDGLVLWAGLREEPALLRLRAGLESGLRREGFPLESRDFCPHVTLCRRAARRGAPEAEKLLPFSAPADTVSLMESLPGRPGAPVYRELRKKSARSE